MWKFSRRIIMSLSKITVCVFFGFVFFSVMLSKFQDTISVNEQHNVRPSKSRNVLDRRAPFFSSSPRITNSLEHLLVFMQISDIHLSLFTDPDRAPDFTRFCSRTVSAVKPAVVLATGDLTDAKTPNLFGSRQYVGEWKLYKQALEESGVLQKTVWLDIRGNHDNFNVPGINSKLNYFREYSVQGPSHRRSYNYTIVDKEDSYTFIALDACMDPGPKRPFNFLGILSEEEYAQLESFGKSGLENSNMTIWFGHYSTSTMVAPHPGPRELMRHSGPYLCGHLHTLGGLVPSMHTLQVTGSLELELSDWKDCRKYRIAAIDHGLFSFVDVLMDEWPVILVTNPKNALHRMPSVEPLHRIYNSTHIRILVFSPYPIVNVRINIDEGSYQEVNGSVKSQLYTFPWDPALYLKGLHTLQVHAEDSSGSAQMIKQSFSLDGARPPFPLLARIVLMGHVMIAQAVFAVLLVAMTLPLCILRVLHHFRKEQGIRRHCEKSCLHRFVFKFYLLAIVDRLFWPLILSIFYVGIGPWLVGELVDGYLGAVFVWGIVIKGTLIPGGLTFVLGTIHLLTFYLPLEFCLASCVYRHHQHLRDGGAPNCSFGLYLWRHVVLFLLLVWQCLVAVGYLLSYGYLALLLGFLPSYSIFLALYLWRTSVTLEERSFHRRPGPVSREEEEDVWVTPTRLAHQDSQETLLDVSKPVLRSHSAHLNDTHF